MAKPQHILAIDQGTTGTHLFIYDKRLNVVGSAYREFTQHFPKPGWVEHDLGEIWQSVEACIGRALRSAGLKGRDIATIGITNQRETTGVWREDGVPLARAIVWQDRRTAAMCAALKARGEEPAVRETTGLVLDPYFSGTKLAWLLEHCRGAHRLAEQGEALFGTVDTWLVYKLTGHTTHVTDVSNASRTLMMGLRTLDWDADCLARLHVPRACLPAIRSSAEVYGTTRGLKSLPDGIPVAGMAGDQQAALFGQACFSPGESKCTYGTGAFLLMNTGEQVVPSGAGLLTTVAWRVGSGPTAYALEGSSFIAGAAVQWLRDGLKLIKKSEEVEALARTVDETGDVVFVPALAGLGAPHWRPDARGLFAGIDRSTQGGHLARALLEGVAHSIYELADAMRRDSGRDIPAFKVDGGAAASNVMMQYQADLLGTPVVRPRDLQTTALGAAALAGLGAGLFRDTEAVRRVWKAEHTFKPKMKFEARARALDKWRRAVERA